MKIIVIGAGYVGLVTAVCFAEMGNHVICIENDPEKLILLQSQTLPIYEPGLEDLLNSCCSKGLLSFKEKLGDVLACNKDIDVIFIAVGTPPKSDGSADLQYVTAAAEEIGQHLQQYVVIANKSTVPVGTAEQVRKVIAGVLKVRGETELTFDVVSNPEFLKEGVAVEDFMRPDRIIIGSDSTQATRIMEQLYHSFERRTAHKIEIMSTRDAELTKYAANAMLATKISFMNEIAAICESMGADVEAVRKGIGSDRRIGYDFIYPGCGFGGSCFPKDIQSLIHMAQGKDIDPYILKAVERRNIQQKGVLFNKIYRHFSGDIFGKRIAVWGLAFKPGTDDMREAPSLVLIEQLVAKGAIVAAYDPEAMLTARDSMPSDWFETGRVILCEQQYSVAEQADALVLVTEWKFFRQPDFTFLLEIMKSPVVFDGRNQYDPKAISELGFTYYGIGR